MEAGICGVVRIQKHYTNASRAWVAALVVC